jgi:ZIP family zinc transporter
MQNNNTTGTGLALDAAAVTGQAWRDAWRQQARQHPWMTAGLALSMAAVTLMLISGIADGLSGGGEPLRLATLGGLAGFAATALGALAGIALGRISARMEDSLLGFAAGMMLAASAFSLILPGLAAGRR